MRLARAVGATNDTVNATRQQATLAQENHRMASGLSPALLRHQLCDTLVRPLKVASRCRRAAWTRSGRGPRTTTSGRDLCHNPRMLARTRPVSPPSARHSRGQPLRHALLALALASCHAPPSRTPEHATASNRASDASERGVAGAPPSRSLREDARFSDIVMSISALEPKGDPGDHCLLGRAGDGYRLGADLASALYPLPAAPDELDEALKGAARARLLSRWGQYGTPHPGAIALAGLTEAPPTPKAIAVILTDRGGYVRATDDAIAALGPLSDEALLRALSAQSALDAHTSVYVTAEASVPLARLHSALAGLDDALGPAVLAIALSPSTPIPEPVSARARPALCPAGLPESAAAQGALDLTAVRAALGPLTEKASACLERADARGAAGGRVEVALRVGDDGRITQACVQSNSTDDAALATCVLEATRALALPAPRPTGEVDLLLPLVLRQPDVAAQAAICPAAR